jgi:hypothetical protein
MNLACCFEQNLVLNDFVHRLNHTNACGSLTFLNKYVAVASSVCVRCRSLASFKRAMSCRSSSKARHSYKERGEAMELTVDGKPAPTTVVYARRRKSLMLALQVVALGPNAASTINN